MSVRSQDRFTGRTRLRYGRRVDKRSPAGRGLSAGELALVLFGFGFTLGGLMISPFPATSRAV